VLSDQKRKLIHTRSLSDASEKFVGVREKRNSGVSGEQDRIFRRAQR
jgi:hypothetical protein